MKKYWLLITICLLILPQVYAAEYGDGILHLGETGYATRADASVTDLDYSKDFSVELIVNIKAHAGSGRWASFIQKGGCLYNATKGWGIGLNQGMFETFGQQFVANIGDGNTSVGLTSGSHQGIIYVVMTFDADTATLHFYTNGVDRGSDTDAALVPANIKNTGSLVIGKGSNKLMQRDILMARLWNRELSSAEAAALYDNYNVTGQHRLPGGFDVSELRSEWLMQETSDENGNPGDTNLKDSIGTNHLQLMDNAMLLRGDGPLAVVYPSIGATNIDKSVYLIASGGIETLGVGLTKPLHYNFVIDEVGTFDSGALKDSGWIKSYAKFKPILKPDTTYYWKVRVKDSSDVPIISDFTGTYSFTTEGPTDWYVRPGVYSGIANEDEPVPVPGVYRNQDGTSYDDAWNGITSIVWGEGGVEAGDNLYICGENVYDNTGTGWYVAALEYIPESGYSNEYPITIRMDCSCKNPAYEDGVMWGIYPMDILGSVTWNGPDENGVYWTSDLERVIGAQFDGTDYVWLNKKDAPTWIGDNGATYVTMQTEKAWLVDATYIKTVDGSAPDINNLWGEAQWGFRFNIGRSSYIKFLNCNFKNSALGKSSDGDTITDVNIAVPHHIVYDGSDIQYQGGTAIPISRNNDNWIVRNCRIHDAGCGVYLTGGGGGSKNNLIENNQIYDIGTQNFPDGDSHAIGLQGGQNHILTHNTIWNIGGTAIEFWTGLTNTMKDHTVSYNFIKDCGTSPTAITSGSGIGISGSNGESTLGMRTGIKIHHNIVMNTAIIDKGWGGNGIATNNPDPQDIFNNVIINSRGAGIKFSIMSYSPAQGRVFNNIIINNNSGYISVGGNADLNNVSINNNIYYPNAASSGKFYDIKYGYLSFTDWQSFTGYDQDSITADPLFILSNPQVAADFKLKNSSPAIDTGVDFGLEKDFENNLIPQGSAADIGAYEYLPGDNVLYGDVSQDDEVSAYDAALCAQAAVGLITLNGEQTQKADVSGDSEVSAYDAALIAQYSVGIINKFPVEV